MVCNGGCGCGGESGGGCSCGGSRALGTTELPMRGGSQSGRMEVPEALASTSVGSGPGVAPSAPRFESDYPMEIPVPRAVVARQPTTSRFGEGVISSRRPSNLRLLGAADSGPMPVSAVTAGESLQSARAETSHGEPNSVRGIDSLRRIRAALEFFSKRERQGDDFALPHITAGGSGQPRRFLDRETQNTPWSPTLRGSKFEIDRAIDELAEGFCLLMIFCRPINWRKLFVAYPVAAAFGLEDGVHCWVEIWDCAGENYTLELQPDPPPVYSENIRGYINKNSVGSIAPAKMSDEYDTKRIFPREEDRSQWEFIDLYIEPCSLGAISTEEEPESACDCLMEETKIYPFADKQYYGLPADPRPPGALGPTTQIFEGAAVDVGIPWANYVFNLRMPTKIAPNSNSYIQYIMDMCGIPIQLPQNAYGWDMLRYRPKNAMSAKAQTAFRVNHAYLFDLDPETGRWTESDVIFPGGRR